MEYLRKTLNLAKDEFDDLLLYLEYLHCLRYRRYSDEYSYYKTSAERLLEKHNLRLKILSPIRFLIEDDKGNSWRI